VDERKGELRTVPVFSVFGKAIEGREKCRITGKNTWKHGTR
jgi:hypothetical protein